MKGRLSAMSGLFIAIDWKVNTPLNLLTAVMHVLGKSNSSLNSMVTMDHF